jgi:hypothetical protein
MNKSSQDDTNKNDSNDYSIINISSVHESIPQPQAVPYQL